MSWFGIEGHDEIVRRFQRAIAQGRIASTFLFLGPAGIGKRMLAERLAMTFQCEKNDPRLMEPCGKCFSCRQALAHEHPDIIFVSKPEDKAFIPIDFFIGPKEARRQMGLCTELAKKPVYQKRKIAIIDDADFLNIEGANSMLKTLEEPPRNSIIILIGTSAARQLPTIRSRCQIVRFSPLKTELVEQILRQKREDELRMAAEISAMLTEKKKGKISGTQKLSAASILPEELIPKIAANSGGSIQEALALSNESFWIFRTEFLKKLSQGIYERQTIYASLEEQINSAGKVPALRRARLRVILETAADFFRRLAFHLSKAVPADENFAEEWLPILEDAKTTWPFNAEGAADMALRTADYLELVQRNVYQPLILDSWLDELIRVFGGESAPFQIAPWALNPNP
ncbi:MAG: DNA polymerase III subunit [Thermoguttaceae bacterium]|nr:DNA polymerase III subunit [Thermoguttaceae bacterium]